MGRVRSKRPAKDSLEKHYLKLTNDLQINKKILTEVANVPTENLINKICIYMKVQKEER